MENEYEELGKASSNKIDTKFLSMEDNVNMIEDVIWKNLVRCGFKSESEFSENEIQIFNVAFRILIYLASKESSNEFADELKAIEPLDFIRDCKKLRMANLTYSGQNIDIEDEEVIKDIELVLIKHYWKKYGIHCQAEYGWLIEKKGKPINIYDVIDLRKKVLKISKLEVECGFFEGNSKVGAMALEMYEDLNTAGIFASDKNRNVNGSRIGTAKEYACIYDTFLELGFIKKMGVPPSNDSEKYSYIRDNYIKPLQKLIKDGKVSFLDDESD